MPVTAADSPRRPVHRTPWAPGGRGWRSSSVSQLFRAATAHRLGERRTGTAVARPAAVGPRSRSGRVGTKAELERVVSHLAGVGIVPQRLGAATSSSGAASGFNCSAERAAATRSQRLQTAFSSSRRAAMQERRPGAALAVALGSSSAALPARLTSAALGPSHADDEVEETLRDLGGIASRRAGDVCAQTARLLTARRRGRLVSGPAWRSGRGRSESRSILASPLDGDDARDRVNAIKGREPWRPLAPSLLASSQPPTPRGTRGARRSWGSQRVRSARAQAQRDPGGRPRRRLMPPADRSTCRRGRPLRPAPRRVPCRRTSVPRSC